MKIEISDPKGGAVAVSITDKRRTPVRFYLPDDERGEAMERASEQYRLHCAHEIDEPAPGTDHGDHPDRDDPPASADPTEA